jgi:hypothetical protein
MTVNFSSNDPMEHKKKEHKLYHACMYNHLPEDEPSGLKHVEDIEKLIY